METETFTNYSQINFLKTNSKKIHVMLTYDGPSSHTSNYVIEKALQENIVIMKLPPLSSQLLQSMDLAISKPLRWKYDVAIIQWQLKNYGTKLFKVDFAPLISQVWG